MIQGQLNDMRLRIVQLETFVKEDFRDFTTYVRGNFENVDRKFENVDRNFQIINGKLDRIANALGLGDDDDDDGGSGGGFGGRGNETVLEII